MSSTTPNFGLPYPALTDQPNVPQNMSDLATATDNAIGLTLVQKIILTSSGIFTFNAIPQNYTNLRIYVTGVSNDTGGNGFSDIGLQLNNDSASDYSYHSIFTVNSATVVAANGNVMHPPHCGSVPNGGVDPTTGAAVGTTVIDIPFYSVSSMSKSYTFITHASSGVGSPNNASVGSGGGIWGNSTAAITTITLFPANSPQTFTAGSRAALYALL